MRLAALALVVASSVAHAAPPEPSGPHPRMLLDEEMRTAWKAQATAERGPVPGSIALCESGATRKHDGAVYQGSEWARLLQACLVAWVATEKPEHAATAVKFFTALLDDQDKIGDGQGGDKSATRDSGYAIRNLGPYTALAYDWLHNAPQMTPALKARARQRWKAWLDWYRAEGYRARVPGTNYQAGFLAAATMIAVAQGSEAAEENGPELWTFVADELWGKDMAKAFAPGGVLEGGDWPEGWQYGPLSVAHYALAARIIKRAGVDVPGVDRWLGAMLRRHVHGLSPADGVYVGQDTQHAEANIAPHVLTLAAIAIGDASPEDKKWAKGELARLRVVDKDYWLYSALATLGDKAELPPRAQWPTWYEATATGTVFARTRWDEKAVWFVSECQHGMDVDHRHPKAGNFVLSRGVDELIVDPSPYGSASSLTSNAPTVASSQFPSHYQPSQAMWGRGLGWEWAVQTRSGVVATRCEYAGTYTFQKKGPDIDSATRDLVLLPNADGTDAALIVVDRARTNAQLHLRFKVPGGLALDGDVGTKQVGSTKMTIASIERTSGRAEVGRSNLKNCFDKGVEKGKCDAARFDASDYRVVVGGPDPRAAHLITATGEGAPVAAPLNGATYKGVRLSGPREAVVIWPLRAARTLSYKAPRGTHVVLDAPEIDGKATVTATKSGDACEISITAGGTVPARPAIFVLDDACGVTIDEASGAAASAANTRPPPVRAQPTSKRSGCCGASATPGSPIAMALIVGALVLRRRRAGTRRG